jgi:L-asparagine transporter-like permease
MENQNNFELNFSLKGNASIQIGIYFLVAAFAIKTILDGFFKDDSLFGALSVEIVEIIIIVITFFTFLCSGLALYFKGKRKAKKADYELWNAKTKKTFWLVILSFIGIFLLLLLFLDLGFIDIITPSFILLYGLLIFLNKNKKRKDLLVLTLACVLLGIIVILIPSYWYSALTILGIAHITYGIAVRN